MQHDIEFKRLDRIYRRCHFIAGIFTDLFKMITSGSLPYILMNIIGAGLACLASWMIHYVPFVILEATWTLISVFALINNLRKN